MVTKCKRKVYTFTQIVTKVISTNDLSRAQPRAQEVATANQPKTLIIFKWAIILLFPETFRINQAMYIPLLPLGPIAKHRNSTQGELLVR